MRVFYLMPGSKKRILLLSALVILLALALAGTSVLKNSAGGKQVLGSREKILLNTPAGEVEVAVKIDTGADSSSIDEEYAAALGLKKSRLKRTVTSARGVEERDVIELNFILGNKAISTLGTAANRGRLSSEMIVGKKDLAGFILDPSREFLTTPAKNSAAGLGVSFNAFFNRVINLSVSQLILAIPILGAMIVFLKIFTGLKTYGIFAPIVIALTMIDGGIINGLIIYGLLLSVGVAVKAFILSGLRLPHIAEMSLIMFPVVAALAVFMALFFETDFFSADIFFPLIITSHLIERFTKSVEEHRLKDALPVLGQTLVTAIIIAYLGLYLLSLPINVLWLIFFFAIPAVIASASYVGPRLSELLRFKF